MFICAPQAPSLPFIASAAGAAGAAVAAFLPSPQAPSLPFIDSPFIISPQAPSLPFIMAPQAASIPGFILPPCIIAPHLLSPHLPSVALAGAKVWLKTNPAISDSTGADGKFSLSRSSSVVAPMFTPDRDAQSFCLHNGRLEFSLTTPQHIAVA